VNDSSVDFSLLTDESTQFDGYTLSFFVDKELPTAMQEVGRFRKYTQLLCLLNNRSTEFVPVARVAPIDVTHKEKWSAPVTKTAIKVLGESIEETMVYELGSGVRPKALLMERVDTVYSVDIEAVPVFTKGKKLHHLKMDMNHFVKGFRITHPTIFFATFGYLQLSLIPRLLSSGVYGFIYFADLLPHVAEDPIFIDDRLSVDKSRALLVGVVDSFRVNEPVRYRSDLPGHYISPMCHFKSYGIRDPQPLLAQYLVVPYRDNSAVSECGLLFGKCFSIQFIDFFKGGGIDFRRMGTAKRLYSNSANHVFSSDCFVTPKLDGVSFYLSSKSVGLIRVLVLTDRKDNIYMPYFDGQPVAVWKTFRPCFVEVVVNPKGGVYLFRLPSTGTPTGFGTNLHAIRENMLQIACSEGILSQKPFDLVRPGISKKIVFRGPCDGMVVYPVMGTQVYYVKSVYTYDVMVRASSTGHVLPANHSAVLDYSDMPSVFEVFCLDSQLFIGRPRPDKRFGDRLDLIDDVADVSDGFFKRKVVNVRSGGSVLIDEKRFQAFESLSSVPSVIGFLGDGWNLTFQYVWEVYRTPLSFLHTPLRDIMTMSEYDHYSGMAFKLWENGVPNEAGVQRGLSTIFDVWSHVGLIGFVGDSFVVNRDPEKEDRARKLVMKGVRLHTKWPAGIDYTPEFSTNYLNASDQCRMIMREWDNSLITIKN
jgi:hypothetical protein